MRRGPLALIALFLIAASPQPARDPALLGYTPEASAAERRLEQQFDGHLDAADLRGWMEELTDQPFFVGSPGDRANAQYIADLFRSWGYETRIETYQVLFPTPKERLLEMTAPTRFRAKLAEPQVTGDRTSGAAGRLPTYNAYSADGDVTGQLVYVNYGIPGDYEELERRGIDVKGKIVIARYGGSWRGIKPKVAAEHGAIGCLIYSDPRDDGYFEGDAWPEGAYRPEQGVQRGSVEDMPRYPGDPLTPGVAATEDAKRYSVAESPVIMKIPVLPISWGDAKPLLDALDGPVAPEGWRGALPITYHVGPGPATVHLKLAFDWSLKPAQDIIAVLRGSELPDQWVVRGNHRDGWAMGAADPISGQVAMLEEAKAVGALARSGWAPKRTIVYAAWDGEEPGLLGSTEWVEDHADELRTRAVAYINSDGNGRGFLGIGGSHTLERFANQLGKDVIDPETGVSVWDRARARRAVHGEDKVLDAVDMPISPLGSGSDYTPFLQHLGIPSLNIGFGGENGGGQYHSQYDSFDHYVRFGDPDFQYGIALAKVAGRATLRLANAPVLPFRFTNFAGHVADYVDEVDELAGRLRDEAKLRNRLVAMNAYTLASDPTEAYVAPDSEATVPFLNIAPLENAATRLKAAAQAYDAALGVATGPEAGDTPTAGTTTAGTTTGEGATGAGGVAHGMAGIDTGRLNALLMSTERLMTRDEGLPRRPWFKHMIYAPGFYTGYGVKTLPGVREGIEEKHYDEAEAYASKIADSLERVSGALEQATALLRRTSAAAIPVTGKR